LETRVGFLLTQVGFGVARGFKERLTSLGLEPPHFGVLQAVAAVEGVSQQTLGQMVHIPPSRMVTFVDALESRGLVERRRNLADRRAYAVHLTPEGRRILTEAIQVAAEYEAQIFKDLEQVEQDQFIAKLRQVAINIGMKLHP
jgi:DNA-binding MarR family transcriptional regulator